MLLLFFSITGPERTTEKSMLGKGVWGNGYREFQLCDLLPVQLEANYYPAFLGFSFFIGMMAMFVVESVVGLLSKIMVTFV